MRKQISYSLIFFSILLNGAQAQTDHFAFAVTSVNYGETEWVALRTLNVRTGKPGNMLLNMSDKQMLLHDHTTHKIIAYKEPAAEVTNIIGIKTSQPATNNGVAAIAYDRKNNRLFYVPMNNDQLRYIDLATMKAYVVADQSFSKAGHYDFQVSSPITRLVIAPDDYGYTVTTNENHLVRFSTNAMPTLTDLGYLVDDPHNNEMSINNTCANAGGDLIADDNGCLYLITAFNRVFKIDIKTRMATFLAAISGLPSQFTTNGAAVDENGKVIVCSSIFKDGYFIVDPKTWKALPAPGQYPIYNCSDLANSNVLHTKIQIPSFSAFNSLMNNTGNIRIFPNPALYDVVTIQFTKLTPGNYTIQLTNALGRTIMQQKAVITSNTQMEVLHIPNITSQGFCYLRVLNEKHNVVSIQKLAIERD